MTSPGTSPGIDLGTSTPPRDPFPRWRRVFPGRDDQVREVRRWLARLLPGAPERDDVIVVAVELVTNAIRHTASGRGGLVMVEVTWCGPVLRVAVADDGARGRARALAAGPRRAGGGRPRAAPGARAGGQHRGLRGRPWPAGVGRHRLVRCQAGRTAAARAAVVGRPPPVGARAGRARRPATRPAGPGGACPGDGPGQPRRHGRVCLLAGLRHHQDRAGRLAQHVLAHRAEQHGGAAPPGQDDELGVDPASGIDQVAPRQAEDGAQFDLVRLVAERVDDRVPQRRLGDEALLARARATWPPGGRPVPRRGRRCRP